MANSLFQKPHYQNQSGRNGFDLTQRRIFTMPAGMLLPAFADYAVAGDKYVLNSDSFIRTEAVQTAAFARLRYHVDWHFVPMKAMYTFWNEFYNQTQDVDTSFVDVTSNPSFTFPKHNFWYFVNDCPNQKTGSHFFQAANGAYHRAKVDDFGVPLVWNFRRLFDMFDMGSLTTTPASVSTGSSVYSLLLKYLAYHKVFYSYYNNSLFFKNNPSLFNVDSYHGDVVPLKVTGDIMCTIHYRPYLKDYFTNVIPAPTFNPAFVNSVLPYSGTPKSQVVGNTTDYNADATNKIELGNETSGAAMKNGGLYMELNGEPKIGPGDIRTLFALDKLYRITAMSGASYEAQTLAHLGFKVPKGIKDSYYIGSQTTDININEVVATASTGAGGAGSVIGDIAGKGFGATSQSENLEFTAPADGVLIGIVSIECIPQYASMRHDVLSRYLDAFDFFHPEFDNIGMIPMYDASVTTNQFGNDLITGWTYRYSELKTKYDVVNESIWDTSKKDWATYKQADKEDFGDGYESVFPTLRSIFFTSPQTTNNIFLLNFPFYTDQVFGDSGSMKTLDAEIDDNGARCWHTNDDLKSNKAYAGDNFIVNSNFKVYKTSIMSVHSLSKLY